MNQRISLSISQSPILLRLVKFGEWDWWFHLKLTISCKVPKKHYMLMYFERKIRIELLWLKHQCTGLLMQNRAYFDSVNPKHIFPNNYCMMCMKHWMVLFNRGYAYPHKKNIESQVHWLIYFFLLAIFDAKYLALWYTNLVHNSYVPWNHFISYAIKAKASFFVHQSKESFVD